MSTIALTAEQKKAIAAAQAAGKRRIVMEFTDEQQKVMRRVDAEVEAERDEIMRRARAVLAEHRASETEKM